MSDCARCATNFLLFLLSCQTRDELMISINTPTLALTPALSFQNTPHVLFSGANFLLSYGSAWLDGAPSRWRGTHWRHYHGNFWPLGALSPVDDEETRLLGLILHRQGGVTNRALLAGEKVMATGHLATSGLPVHDCMVKSLLERATGEASVGVVG